MRKSRLSQYKQNKLIELFVAGVTARTAAELVGVNKNTAAYYSHRLRLLIYQNSPHLEETFAKFLFPQQPKPQHRFSAVFAPNTS